MFVADLGVSSFNPGPPSAQLMYFHLPFAHCRLNDEGIFNTTTGLLELAEDADVDLSGQVWIPSGAQPPISSSSQWNAPPGTGFGALTNFAYLGAKLIKNPVLYQLGAPEFQSTLGVGGEWLTAGIGVFGTQNQAGVRYSGAVPQVRALDHGVAGDKYGLFALCGPPYTQIQVDGSPYHTWFIGTVVARDQ